LTSSSSKGSGASGPDLPELVNAAIGGNNDAWNALVQRFAPLVAVVAQRHRLSHCVNPRTTQNTTLFRPSGQLAQRRSGD
jgi:hypothetical protein